MARLKIELPEEFPFSTRLRVRIGDIAGGLHLGNHFLIAYLNEALLVLLREHGFSSLFIENHAFINTDLKISYLSQSMHGDILEIEIAIKEFLKYGCDFCMRVTNERTGLEVAHAQMTMLFIDYDNRKLGLVPETFKAAFWGIVRRESKERFQSLTIG